MRSGAGGNECVLYEVRRTTKRFNARGRHTVFLYELQLILLANPQDFTHPELERPVKAALPRLGEIHIPSLLLVGDADIPDVHAHAGAIEAAIPRARRLVINDVAISCISRTSVDMRGSASRSQERKARSSTHDGELKVSVLSAESARNWLPG